MKMFLVERIIDDVRSIDSIIGGEPDGLELVMKKMQ
jgi:hypothetical protein